MARHIRLRPWQREALALLEASEGPDFLAVATPGAGKTTFALTAARTVLSQHRCRLVVVAPTAHLKFQWAEAASRLDLHLDPDWSPVAGALPTDMHGIVTTYQQLATAAPALARVAAGAFVIFDEIHHAADERAWGSAVRVAFDGARGRLALSGTPFRSDTAAIPFVRYHLDEAVPDFEYGYGEALSAGNVVRPVYFPRIDGDMEWSAADGTVQAASFSDALDRTRSSERLRTALSLDGEWLPSVLRAAQERLVGIRRDHPEAGGLIIATDQDHAHGIGRILRDRFGTSAVVVTSDDPTASSRIARFAKGTEPWIVAVRMVSEGVDIPRLRVGVFATTTSTELFFRQAVGRLVRWVPGRRSQKAYLFIPDDPRLRNHAFSIAEQRRHSLRRPVIDDATLADDAAFDDARAIEHADDEQLSLFAAISAVATDVQVHTPSLFDDEPDAPEHPEDPDDPDLLVALAPLPPLAGSLAVAAGTSTRKQEKERLRAANAALARALAQRTSQTHQAVNVELNRLAGVKRVSEATLEQLERRLRAAERWWQRLSPRRS